MVLIRKDQQRKSAKSNSAGSVGLKRRRTADEIFDRVLITEKISSATLNHGDNFSEFCGLWTESDLLAFELLTANTRRIYPEEWK